MVDRLFIFRSASALQRKLERMAVVFSSGLVIGQVGIQIAISILRGLLFDLRGVYFWMGKYSTFIPEKILGLF